MTIVDERRLRRSEGRADWSSWPQYEAATLGLPGPYWYPVMWSRQLRDEPVGRIVAGRSIVFVRDQGAVHALHDRCPHRGVPLSLGDQQFPGTLSCPYHGWTFDVSDGVLCAVITDGADSPICGKIAVERFPTAERLGLVWVFVGPPGTPPTAADQVPAIETAIPGELLANEFSFGGNIEERHGGWRFGAENGFDEGHAKYLHRTAWWRLFKQMPTWTKTRIDDVDDGWIVRVQTEVHWEEHFPGLGTWSSKRWWMPGDKSRVLGSSPSHAPNADPVIAAMDVAGNQFIRLPGLLRIVHSKFIHYEWYVPVDEDRYRYVQMMVQFKRGLAARLFRARYMLLFRWLFHGQFSGQDEWMVDVMDAPPERLYRPDISITAWRRLCQTAPGTGQLIVEAPGEPVEVHR